MQYQIEIFGKASKKIYKVISFGPSELNKNLMDYLRANDVPIGSSCLGQELCKKCMINNNLLSCSVTVQHLFDSNISQKMIAKIEVDYL